MLSLSFHALLPVAAIILRDILARFLFETARKQRVATHVTDYVSNVGESLSRDPAALTRIDTHGTIKPAIKYETARLEERSRGVARPIILLSR